MDGFMKVHLLNGVVERILHMLTTDTVTVLKSHSSMQDELQKLEEILYAVGAKLSDVHQSFEDALMYITILEEVAYDIEDLLDLAATQHLEPKTTRRGYLRWMVRKRLPFHSSGFSSELKHLLKRLDELTERMGIPKSKEKEGIPESKEKAGIHKSKEKPGILPTFSFNSTTKKRTCYDQILASEGIIVGREEEKERLIHLLLSFSFSHHPNVVMVSGPHGVGKNTLVKQVLSDTRASSTFDLVLWAHYHRQLSYLISEIIDCSQATSHPQGMDVEGLKQRLHEILQGRKYLLVLDDFLDAFKLPTSRVWNELWELLKAGSTGSTVILISGSHLEFLGDESTKVFELRGISEDYCWYLFKRYAGLDEAAKQVDENPLFEHIGRSIATKCYGSPLFVKTLASLLCSNRDIDVWKQIDEHEYHRSLDVVTALLLILKQVPSRLIQCYVTSCMLGGRKDVVSKDQLIFFWMAQGLLQSTKEDEDLRDIGNRLCNELLQRNLLQLHSLDGLHHEWFLAPCLKTYMRLPATELVDGKVITYSSGSRYLISNGYWDEKDSHLGRLLKHKPIKALLINNASLISKSSLDQLFLNVRCLRVLLLNQSKFEELPGSIGRLKLLRYLSLGGNNKLRVLHDHICKLANLQTLDLSGCNQLQKLPKDMHKLQCLRHLLLSLNLTNLPEKVLNSWTSLNLLKICHCQHLNSFPEEMGNLTALRTLQIHDCPSIASLPNSMKFLTGLKELSIVNCQNMDLTGWEGLLDLRCLKFLQLQGLPKLWELPDGLQSTADSLERLVISSCTNLRMLPESLGHCTSLLELIIESNPNLPSLPQEIQALKNLQVLKILHCPNLLQRFERKIGDDWHLISHIPIIYLQYIVIRNKSTFSTWIEHPGVHHSSTSEYQSEITSVSNDSTSAISDTASLFGSTKPPHSFPAPSGFGPAPSVTDYHSPCSMQQLPIASSSKPPPSSASTGADTHDERLDKEVHEIQRKAKGNIYSETDRDEEKSHHLVVGSSSKIESLPEEFLFLFRNGYEFEKDMLIQLWIAEGFIKNEPMEINSAKYFEELVSEGYISCSSSNSLYYKVNSEKADSDFYSMRDKQNYLILGSGSQDDAESAETLHVSVVCDDIDETVFKTLRRFNRLRTLLFLGKNGGRLQQVPRDLFLCYESLVALDLSGTLIEELPSSVVKMIHLRYLDLSWTLIEFLPERIDHFRYLQTLKLKGCSRLLCLPENMKRLIDLRHLDLDVISQLDDMPEGMGSLIKLQSLSAFLVGTEEGFKIRELKDLDNITGEFCIARLEHVQSADEAQEASLKNKSKLKKLELRWSNCQFPESNDKDECVLEKLCPCSDLEEIKIICYFGAILPSWIADLSFDKLISITLFKCQHVSMLPSLGKLPSLQSLQLISLNSVTKMDCMGKLNHAAFLKLQNLLVDEMLNLETWAEAKEGDYPCLVELMIKDCPKLSKLPSLVHLPSLKQLEISGCAKVALVSEKALSNSLQQLIVEDCPLIKERCSEREGQDWHKIKHVPNTWIDQTAIETCENDNDLLSEDDDVLRMSNVSIWYPTSEVGR